MYDIVVTAVYDQENTYENDDVSSIYETIERNYFKLHVGSWLFYDRS